MPRRSKNLPLAVASDHAGYEMKSHVLNLLAKWKKAAVDMGTSSVASVDYPDFAVLVAQGVLEGCYQLGILICGSGIGMSIAANRFVGIRAAVCTSAYMAEVARRHNDANILCLGSRVVGLGEAEHIVRSFLENSFDGGRHRRRIAKLDATRRT